MPAARKPTIRPALLIALAAAVVVAVGCWIALASWKIPAVATAPPAPLTPPEQVGAEWLKPVGAEAEYIGSAACKPCHAREFEDHALTPHAQTVRRLQRDERRPEFASRVEVVDTTLNTIYRVQPAGDANRLL